LVKTCLYRFRRTLDRRFAIRIPSEFLGMLAGCDGPSKTPDEAHLKKVNEVVARLIDEHGYNSNSANELLKYVGSLLNR